MKFFANNHLKRQFAWVMLALWLLVVASGVAYACFSNGHERTPAEVVAGTVEKAHAPTVGHDPLSMTTSHGDDTEVSSAPCLKVCDDGSQALQKKTAKSDLTGPGPAFVVATLWGVATPALLAVLPSDDPPTLTAGSSLQIRYSRWAL